MIERLWDLVERAPAASEAVADRETRLDYRQFRALIRTVAAALIDRGVQSGDRVAVLAPPGIFAWASFLATAAIGGIWLGLNPRYRLPELASAIRDAEPAMLLACADDLPDLFPPTSGFRPSMGLVSAPSEPELTAALIAGGLASEAVLDARIGQTMPDQPCLIVYTSGSTGRPKGALLHQRGICRFAQTQNRLWPVRAFRILNFLPINHIGNLVDIGAAALAAGGFQRFEPTFHPRDALQTMADERVTIWGSVPTVFRMQLDLPDFDRFDLSSVELIVWGGAAMPAPLIPRLAAICPRLATNYGMTETSSAITSLGPTAEVDLLARSVGAPFPGVDVRLDPETGEILARSGQNFCGYWRDPAATAAAFTADGFFRTGDAGAWLEDGTLQLVGRVKFMFKSGGYNIWPAEIEAVLADHPDILEAAVVATPDPVWQEVGVAFVVTARPAAPAALDAWCRERLANYKIPKR
ncbi:MAG: class I adenylate-forming enzyme family protein, partial [Thermaurantiacus sp.]